MKENQEAEEFWLEKEKITGAPVVYRSFAILLGNEDLGKRELSGILFISGGSAFFEDFENEEPLGWLIKRKKKRYKKYQFSFPLSEVSFHKITTDRDAGRCLLGSCRPEETKAYHPLKSLGARKVCQVTLKTGGSCFFEILDLNGFIGFLPAAGKEN